MGSDCSTEREMLPEKKQTDQKGYINNNLNNLLVENGLPNFVEIKNYKEYNYKMESMKKKILDKLDKFKKSRKLVDLNLLTGYNKNIIILVQI